MQLPRIWERAPGARNSPSGCRMGLLAIDLSNALKIAACRVTCHVTGYLTIDLERNSIYIYPGSPWRNSVVESPLYRRGWTLQERALSTRIIHWAKKAVYWECSTLKASEYRLEGIQFEEIDRFIIEALFSVKSLSECNSAQVLGEVWLRLIKNFTSLDLSYSISRTDCRLSQELRKGSRHMYPDVYLAGLWRKRLCEGLAWYSHTNGDLYRRISSYIAPS
jgi:hypothetical protein